MAQPQQHRLPSDGTMLQPGAAALDLDPWLQSDDVETWAGNDNTSPDIISGFDQSRFGLGPSALLHSGINHPSVTQGIHHYPARNVFAPQPAQGTQIPYYGNGHSVHYTGLPAASLNNCNGFNWAAPYHDELLSYNGVGGHLPVAEADYMAMLAPEGYGLPLQTTLSQIGAEAVDNAYTITGLATLPPYDYGELDQVAFGQNPALPMQEAFNNSVFAINQSAPGAPPLNTGANTNYVWFSHGSKTTLGAGEDGTAVATNEMPSSGTLVTLSPIVSAGACVQMPQNQKTGKKFVCQICQYEAMSARDLQWHTRQQNHRIYKCPYDQCDGAFSDLAVQRKHLLGIHVSDQDDHGHVRPIFTKMCDECHQVFERDAEVSRHARELQHRPYACKCSKKFSRVDVLERHLRNYQPGQPTYPCTHCKRHRGDNGFKRPEHLTQHLRNYHHIGVGDRLTSNAYSADKWPVCSHLDCPQYRNAKFFELQPHEQYDARPFASQADFTNHMREVHEESTFPCDVPHCHRVGGKGYFREKDLMNHRRAMHPDATPYVAAERQVLHSCREPNCLHNRKRAYCNPWRLRWHLRRIHGYSWAEAYTRSIE